MTILHVTKKFPLALGGDAVVVSHMRQEQRKAGHRVVIVTSNCDEITAGKDIYKVGLKDTATGLDAITTRRLVSLLMLFVRMFWLLKKTRPDVIHTHSIDMGFAVAPAARLYRIPVVHTFHIVTFYDQNQAPLRRKSELWLTKKSRFASITAPNSYDVSQLRQAGLAQTNLLANGVNISFWQTHSKIGQPLFQFVAVGRLEQQKGYEYLIGAAARLRNSVATPFAVLIIGSGTQETQLRAQAAKLGVEDITSFLGRQNPRAIKSILAGAGAVVLPSLYETTPLTLLEAWAAGTPVITTPVGILRETPPRFSAAQMVEPQDEFALATAMEYLLTNPVAREKLAVNGQKEVQQYAWPAITQQLESLYRSIV